MSDGDDLGHTLPPAKTTARNEGTKQPAPLPDESPGRFADEVKELGRGGMGRVLEVQDVSLGRWVAVKELLDAGAGSARFVREAQLTARLEHPGVPPVYELGRRRDGAPYYAMRRVQGGTLDDALDACANLEERLVLLPHFVDVVQTAAYAHSKGILHRDLKPQNVMVGPFGETLLLDWGLARPKGEAEVVSPEVAAFMGGAVQTHEGASIGTPAYMSPEQAQGEAATLDERADVWSLGVMLFELLTGRLPFEAQTAVEMLAKVVRGTPPPVQAVEPRAPAELARIADRALQRERTARYPSAVEMAAALEAALRSRTARTQRPWGTVVLAGLASVACVALLGLNAVTRLEASDQAAKAARAEGEAERRVATERAERAQSAWESGDLALAQKLATEAGGLPLARGVRALVSAAGLPERLWSARTEAGCAQLAAVPGSVACATFGGLQLFDATDGQQRARVSAGPSGWQHAVMPIAADGVFVFGGDDGAVKVVDPISGNVLDRLEGLGDSVRSLVASADGTAVAVGLRDGRVLLWSRGTATPTPLTTLVGPITALAWSRDGLVAASGRDATRVVKADSPEVAVFELSRPARALAFAAGWPLYLSAGRDVLAVSPHGPPQVFSGARHDVSSLALLNSRLVASSVDGEALGWNLDGAPTGVMRVFEPGRVVIAAADGRSGGGADFFAATGRSLEAWQWKRERFSKVPPELSAEPTAWTLGPEGAWCAGLRDGRLACGKPRLVPADQVAGAPVRALTVTKSEAGTLVVSAAEDGTVRVAGAPAPQLSRPGRRPLALAVAAKGQRLAVSWDDGQRVLFSFEYRKEIDSLKEAAALALAFSSSGQTLAVARADKQVVLVEALTGKEVRQLEGADSELHAVAFDGADARVAAGGTDGKVLLWNVADGRLLRTFMGPRGRVGALAFSNDGARLAAASDDGTVRVWSTIDSSLEAEVRGHFGDARVLAFRADGTLLEAGGDGVPRVINLGL